MLGRSKMKILRTIVGHLGLLARFAGLRVKRRWAPAPDPGHLTATLPPAPASGRDVKPGPH
jgi:hypothetical protein